MKPIDAARQHLAANIGHEIVVNGFPGDKTAERYCLDCEWSSDHAVAEELGTCGVTEQWGGTTFVCVLPVHDDGKKKDQFDSRGRPARWRRHWFQEKFPYAHGG